MIGRTLAHFEITAKLGEGGMGEVYEARDTDLKRLVALKVLPPELAADPDRLERFRREAESLAALSHPNIVTIYSVERADDLHFLTMERVGGESLDQRIPAEGFELEEFLDLAVPLAEALAAAHEKGITHRDLKPANIMITDTGQLKVLDFGLAKLDFGPAADEASQIATMAMTREGAILGTVPYMSPEQAQGKPVDPRSDVFSLGRSLTGDPVPILRSTKHFLRAAVSPDGERIIYSSTEPQEDLYTIRSDGTGKLQLTDDSHLDRGATFSPDGSRIVFFSSRTSTVDNRHSSVWTISPDGGDLRLLLDDPAMTLGSPVWSPDGRVISVMGRKSDVWRLYLFDLAHQSEPNPVEHLRLVQEGENFSGLTWSPDGRLLAGYGNEGIVPLKVYDFDRATFRTVRDPSGSVLEAAATVFLSDSRRLLYCDWRNGTLGIWDLATDEVRPIPGPRFGGRCKISLTADEQTMVGSSILEEADVWLLEFKEGQ